VGPFDLGTKVTASSTSVEPPKNFKVNFDPMTSDIRVTKCTVGGDVVTLGFVASKSGDFTGTVVLNDLSGRFAPLRLAYRFAIKKKAARFGAPQ
jgi:hypothetical protein